MLGVTDRVLHYLPQSHRPVPREQEHPGAECGGHARGQHAGAGHEIKPEAGKRPDARRRRRRALTVQHEYPAVCGAKADDGNLATGPVQMRLHNLKNQSGSDRSVESVAAGLQRGHPGRRGEPVRGRHHAECAGQFGPGGELLASCHCRLPPSPTRRRPRLLGTTGRSAP